MQKKEKYSWGRFLKDYWLILKGRRLKFTFWTALRSSSDLLYFFIAYLVGRVIDFFTRYNTGDSLFEFYILVLLIAFSGGFSVWLRFFAKIRMQTIAAEIRKEVRVAAMSKLMDLELKWHEKEETGSKIHKINYGGESIFRGFRDFSNHGVFIIVSLVMALAIFAVVDIRYAIYAFACTGIYLYAEYYFSKKMSYWEYRMNKIREKVSGKLHESASNLLTVKSLGLNEVFKKHTTSYEKQYYNTWVKARDASQLKVKSVKIFSAVAFGGFILILGLDVVAGAITLGSIYIFANYFSRLNRALHELTNRSKEFIEVKSSVGRFMALFGAEVFEREEEGLLEIPKNWKKIEFRNATFRYKDKDVLKNFSLTIKRNDKIGIAGKSGCGKSTLVKLLLGLYTLNQGKILVDGKELKEYKQKSITDTMSVVLQESEMFNLSLLDNITISSLRKDLQGFKRASRIAQLEPLIQKLPQGLNTLIGERGYKLSGGERQRVGIARAIYKNASIMILDEATAALDSKTEQLIQNGIERNLKDKTLLIIAHRLSTLKKADRIIFMQNGRIVEAGSFEELVKNKGKFYEMYKLQKGK